MTAFNLKAGLNPITTLLVQTTDLAQIQQELQAKIEQAPKMFIRLPCIFDFIELEENIDLPSLYLVCHEFGMLPIGVRNAQADHYELLEQLELADFGKGKSKPPRIPKNMSAETAEVDTNSAAPQPKPTVEILAARTTVHKFPVRSGQQLTAEGDLIIFGLVSAGAEVLAGGSIQIFGPLRGRALAGIKGNANATISCQSLEAELVAIAGEYKLFENSELHSSQASLIQLDDGRLNIDSL
jgi:septum site-determining protein MinC